MKKFILFIIIALTVGYLLKKSWQNNDFKLGIITPGGVALLSISPERDMINLLSVEGEVELWFPGGMGWYASDKLLKIYESDKDVDLIKKTFYYNFGFIPEDIVILNEVKEWRSWDLVKHLGPLNWLRYVLEQESWLYKTDTLTRSMEMEKEKLDELLPRDFADSELLTQEIKVIVINDTRENGLGSFVADRLNWMGFSVMEVRSEQAKKECEIMLRVGSEGITKKYTEILAKEFGCSLVSSGSLLENEIVLYLGESYASMIKYNSYVRTF
jgi:hypothetical protein